MANPNWIGADFSLLIHDMLIKKVTFSEACTALPDYLFSRVYYIYILLKLTLRYITIVCSMYILKYANS